MNTGKQNSEKLFFLIFSLLIILHCSLPAFSRLIPSIDLPMHLASSTISKNIQENGTAFTGWFYLKSRMLQTNRLFEFFSCLPLFPNIETAAHVWYMLYLALLPLSLLLVIRRFGGQSAYALLGFLVLYNTNVIWGFTNCFMSIPLVLFLVIAMTNYFYKERTRDTVVIILVFILLYLTHGLVTTFSMFLFGMAVIYRYFKNPKKMVLKGLVVLVPLALMTNWVIMQASENTGNLSALSKSSLLYYYMVEFLPSLPERLFGIFFRANWLYNHFGGRIFSALFTIMIVVFIAINFNKTKFKEKIFSYEKPEALPLILLSSMFVLLLLLPAPRGGLRFTFIRVGVFIFLFLILTGSVFTRKRLSGTMLSAMTVVCLAHFFLCADFYRDFNRENKEFTTELLPEPDSDKIMTGLVFEPFYRGHPMYVHFPNYYITWKHGIATPRFTSLGVIWRVGAKSGLPQNSEWLYINLHRQTQLYQKYSNVDYLLVRKEMTPEAAEFFTDFKMISQGSGWQVWGR